MKKKGRKLLLSLFAAAGILIGSGQVVQAAENVIGIDLASSQNLANVTQSWDSFNKEANLTGVQAQGLVQAGAESSADGKSGCTYYEAPGILGYPDTSSYIIATYSNIGTISGRSVSVKVKFGEFYGKSHGQVDTCVIGQASYVNMEHSGLLLNNCFWEGYYQHNIERMQEQYHLYFADTGESISCKNAYFTANSLNVGESVQYITEGQGSGNLNTFLRTDHQLQNVEYGHWVGISNNFTDDVKALDYTRNSVCFQLCTDDPIFIMHSESCDFFHNFNVSPLGATVPEGANKVGLNQGTAVDHFSDVNIGDTLVFRVSQKVEYLGVSGAVRYQSFVLTDELPRELTYQSANVTDEYGNVLSASQVNIAVNNGVVTASFTDDYLRNGMRYAAETYNLHVAVTVNDAAGDTDKFTNQGYSVINGTKSAVKTVDVSAKRPKLSIQKQAAQYEYQVGDTVEYTIKVNQTVSGAVAKNVTVTDTSLPEGLAVAPGDNAISVDAPGANVASTHQGNGFAATIDRLSSSATIKVRCIAKESANGKIITNTASAKANNAPTPVTASAQVYINSPKLSIAKSVDHFEYQVGDTVVYTIKVDQTVSGALARNVVVTDTSLPEGLAVAAGGDAVSVNAPGAAVTTTRQGNGFAVTLDALSSSATIQVKCTAKESVNGNIITNTVSAKANNAPTPVTASARVYVNSPALSIEKKADHFEWQVGEDVVYTIKVNQTRPGCQAKTVKISDTSLPEGLAVSSAGDAITVSYANSWTDRESGAVKTNAAATARTGTGFTVTVDRVEYNAPVIIKVKCTAKESANGNVITNTAAAAANNAPTPVTANARVYINSPALSIEKKADHFEWQVGEDVVYTIKVNQIKPGCQAKTVKISDTSLPEGLAVSSAGDAITVSYANSWTDKESGAVKTNAAATARTGTGFTVTVDRVEYNAPVIIKVKCTAKNSVNGHKIINTARAEGSNVNVPVSASARVYINSPEYSIQKQVSKYEWRVGNTVDYTITLKQTINGCLAKDVEISDLSLPEGLSPSNEADAITVNYPQTWTDPESEQIRQTAETATKKNNGFVVNLDRLETTVVVKVKCVVAEPVNGNITINTVHAKGSNVKIPVKASAKIYVNSPGVHMAKECDKNYVKSGEVISYTLSIDNVKVGTIGRNIVISDEILTDGLKLQKSSIVLLDSAGNPINNANVTIEGNSFTIKTGRTLICPDKNYKIVDKDAGTTDGGAWNPEGIQSESSFTVEYNATATKSVEEGGILKNEATVSCDEGTRDTDMAEIPVNGAALEIRKTSNKSVYTIGESGHYKLTIRETRESLTAKDVTVTDAFEKEGMTLDETSITAQLNGKTFTPQSVELNEKHNGFTITTGKDLTDTDKLVIGYDVGFDAVTAGETYKNDAAVSGSNTKQATDSNEVEAEKGQDPELMIVKKAENEKAKVGDTNTYEIKVTQEKRNVKAKNVVIYDAFDADGAVYVQDSLKLTDKTGDDLTKDAVVAFSKNGFVIKTGQAVGYNDCLTVTYSVQYKDSSLGGSTLMNKASAVSDDAPEVVAAAQVKISADAPELSVVKTASAKTLHVGDTNFYKIKVIETKEGETARNVIIRDTFDQKGAEYVKDSLKVTDQNGTEVDDISVIFSDTGFEIRTGKNLSFNQSLTVSYNVIYTAEALKSGTIKNTAIVGNDTGPDTDGGTTVEIVADSPQLVVQKKAAKEQAHVGDTNTYTITVTQTKAGEIAKNVVIRDTMNREGVEYLEKTLKVTKKDGQEVTGCKVTFSNTGFILETGTNLSANQTLIVTYQVKYAEKTLAGENLKNTAIAEPESGDAGKGESTVELVEDAPVLTVKKEAEQEEVHVGDTNTYTITVNQTKVGEVAKNVVITDSMNREGVEYQKDTLTVTTEDGQQLKDAKVTWKDKGFVLKTGADISGVKSIFVTYQVKYADADLAGDRVKNTASAKPENGKEQEDDATVKILTDAPELSVEKKAEKAQVRIGDTNTYTITVTQTKAGETAKDVVIRDSFNKEGVEYLKDTLVVTGADGQRINPLSVTWTNTGFEMETGADIGYKQSLVVTYQVKYTKESLSGGELKNTATAGPKGEPGSGGDSVIEVVPEDPELSVVKKAEKAKVHIGDTNTYTITVTQTKEGETAKDVVIRDSFNKEGVEYLKDTLVVTGADGQKINPLSVTWTNTGFEMETGADIGYKQSLVVTYQVKYTKESLSGGELKNTATAGPKGEPGSGGDSVIEVVPEDPELSVVKEAEKTQLSAGDTNTYTITIKQTKEGETARNIVYHDKFTKSGAEYIKDSVKLKNQDGAELKGMVGIFSKNKFTLKTNHDLAYGESFILTYQVKYKDSFTGDLTNQVTVSDDSGNTSSKVGKTVGITPKAASDTGDTSGTPTASPSDTADTTKNVKKSKAPQTGLQDHIILYTLLGTGLLVAGAAGIVYLSKTGNKKNSKKSNKKKK